jgi:hypothetical protein
VCYEIVDRIMIESLRVGSFEVSFKQIFQNYIFKALPDPNKIGEATVYLLCDSLSGS